MTTSINATTAQRRIVRVLPSDVQEFLNFRAQGLRDDADHFRIAVEDDLALGELAWRSRLAADYVVALHCQDHWIGVGGLSFSTGEKLGHKGLIWGMYVAPDARGTGVAKLILEDLILQARGSLRQVQLTVMADNARAISFYEGCGFLRYGIEPDSVRRNDGFADEMLMWRLA